MKMVYVFLGLLAVCLWSACFAMGFGFGYEFKQSWEIDLLFFLAAFAVMGLVLFLLCKWANPDSGVNYYKARVKEMGCLAAYVLLALLTCGGFGRFVTVQTELRTALQKKALTRINDLKKMFADEEKEGSYQYYVEQMAERYQVSLQGKYMDVENIRAAVARFQDDLMGDDNSTFNQLKGDADKFLPKCEQTIVNWIPWSLTECVKDLDKYTQEWTEELSDLSETHPWVKEMSEPYKPQVSEDVALSGSLQKAKSGFGFLSIVLGVILQVMALFPYIRSKDWSRSGPIRYTGSNGPIPLSKAESSVKEPEEI